MTTMQRKVAVTLTNHLSRPYHPATMNHLASICEEEYDTPQKVEVLRNSIEYDDLRGSSILLLHITTTNYYVYCYWTPLSTLLCGCL